MELPRLGLRTREDSFLERQALEKIAALPCDVSSSTEWSQTPMDSGTSRAANPSFAIPSLTKISEAVVVDTGSLNVVFDANGREVTCQVSQRPLGAEFRKRESGDTKVSQVIPGSHAAALGLEAGWTLKQIAGADVTRKSFVEIQEALKSGLQHLPFSDCSLQQL